MDQESIEKLRRYRTFKKGDRQTEICNVIILKCLHNKNNHYNRKIRGRLCKQYDSLLYGGVEAKELHTSASNFLN